MNDSESISISFNANQLTGFCEKLVSRSCNLTKTHDTLLTLESFISVFGRPAHNTSQFAHIQAAIKSIIESSRQLLLEQYTVDLLVALQQCNAKALAGVHTPLSRNEFYQILKTAISQLNDDDIRLVMIWSANWIQEAKRLSEEIGGNTDAMNFNQADISSEEFQAISDIDRVLNVKV